MRFKMWCLTSYGISSISEGKVINRVFLPEISARKPDLDQQIIDFGGYLTTHQGRGGLTFTEARYNSYLYQLKEHFIHLNQWNFEAMRDFETHKNKHFRGLGYDVTHKEQYRTLPNVHLKFNTLQEQEAFMQRFDSFSPRLSYDVLHQTNTVEIPASFLKYLYANYYQSPIAYNPSLSLMVEHSHRLKQLMQQIERNKLEKTLDSAQLLALDYDNKGKFNIINADACSAYAMSLKIYAELHRFALSSKDFNSLYAAANLLAAYDRYGYLKQSLKTDACFVDFIKMLYDNYLDSIDYETGSVGLPLLASLPKAIFEDIKSKIDQNVCDLLYGNYKTQYDENAYCMTSRFFPDSEGHSDIDELILQGGEMRGHSANFRLIKVAIMENGREAKPGEIPHHYDYFKVVNNLGDNCHDPDIFAKICSGTFVTKIIPCSYSENGPVRHNIDPYTDPKGYQALMEKTLQAIIITERQLQFYRKPSGSRFPANFQLNTIEENEWFRLNRVNQQLSGDPYPSVVYYMAQDALNPSKKYRSSVITQRGYMQEGGSCPIFSIKSLTESILGNELATMHMNFMQQFGAAGCLYAIKEKVGVLDSKIDRLSPLLIEGSRVEIKHRLNEFKNFLRDECQCSNLHISLSSNRDKSTIILSTSFEKERWADFLKYSAAKENYRILSHSNSFFSQTTPVKLLSNPLRNAGDSYKTPRAGL